MAHVTRGRFLIHAGRMIDPDGFQALWEMGLYRRLPETLPLGRLIGSVELADIHSGYPSKWAIRGRVALATSSSQGISYSNSLPR